MPPNPPPHAPETIEGREAYRGLVMERVRQAGVDILIQTHHLEFDAFGQALLSELEYACQRGLEVRILIDAHGSRAFIRDHPTLLARLETRFRIHRHEEKGSLLIFDRRVALIGSHTLCESGLEESFSRIHRGGEVERLGRAFDRAWSRARFPAGGSEHPN